MATRRPRKLFVNMAVRDLDRSKQFFTKLGFEFDLRFTDEKATCMLVGEDAYVMLLVEPFFRTFTKKGICDTLLQNEVACALTCESRAEVDELVKKAIAAGGKHAMEPQDRGFMYSSSFYDLDGHHWEVLWMDPKALER
ncbi:VOC family protein [Anaeromyxobacter terrae]|uniref:VOC family protein n=1 Tax=Anaeromyxobacter terrae TaxID=2925406 RepID=UPI001F5764BC|nr:VOC family protein [Anaeromyxobacter sp. SG22]